MRTKASILVILLGLTVISSASAVDEGQTQPRLDKRQASYGQVVDLVPLTSGSGNVKGVQCKFSSGATYLDISFLIDGGAAQSINIPNSQFSPADGGGTRYTEFIPMNLRFETSIRVQMLRNQGSPVDSGQITCVASWALD